MKNHEPPKPRPVVIRQAWMVTLADGSRHDMGHSFHLKDEDRIQYVCDAMSLTDPGSTIETIGEPELIHVTEEQYALIKATPHGLRVG